MTTDPIADIQLYPGWLTADITGTGGVIRRVPEDFQVTEIPAYGPTGEGQHTLFEIRKTSLSTMEAISRLSRSWNVPAKRIGSAGLKDRHAVTQQHLSVEGIPPDVVASTEIVGIEVLWAERHRNRLKIGHLRGNRFRIRIRDVAPNALYLARQVLDVLEAKGVPNHFGPQRFGARQTSHLLGHAILTQDAEAMVTAMLARPQPSDPSDMQEARRLVDTGNLSGAVAVWSPRHGPEYRLLGALARGDSPDRALRRLPHSLRQLYVNAYQSLLFNQIVIARMPLLGELAEGDLAIKHPNGAFFGVDDPALEQPRADRLEISPSGALFGRKTRLAGGSPGELERDLMSRHGLTPELWKASGARGDRRALRVPMGEAFAQKDDQGIVLSFALPSGAYATNVIGEITKIR